MPSGREQHGGHQAKRTEALRYDVGLHVAVIVLAGPDVAARPFQRRGDHVVDQAVFIGQLALIEFGLEFAVKNLGEDVFEAAVIDLEDGVLGREVDREIALQAVVERGARELLDRFVEVVHGQRHAVARRLEHFLLDDGAVLADELDGQRALAREAEIGGAILVAEGMTADDDRLGPAGHQARHVLADDRLAEDDAAKDVADRAVRRLPHFPEVELLHARFIGGDGGAFHRNAMALGGLGGLDGDLVAGLVTVLDAEVVIVELEVEIGEDQLVLDLLPDDPGHLVAVHIDYRIGHLDLRHRPRLIFWEIWRAIALRHGLGKLTGGRGWAIFAGRGRPVPSWRVSATRDLPSLSGPAGEVPALRVRVQMRNACRPSLRRPARHQWLVRAMRRACQ